MTVLNAPLLSFGASGAIAKTQVYSTWKGRAYARRYVIPANPNTAEQQLTRNTFSFLNNVWKYMPAAALEAWDLYGDSSRFTARNGWLKVNLGNLREEADLDLLVMSPAAGGGLAAASITPTGGNDQITVTLGAPALPSGWTIVEAIAAAIEQQDPQTGGLYTVAAATDATDPYAPVITGLKDATEYVVGGWFKFLKPNGENAYGQALSGSATTT